jgi:hypothetical protein
MLVGHQYVLLNNHSTDIQALEGLVDGSTILVKNGNTLSEIAQANGMSLNELLALNPTLACSMAEFMSIPRSVAIWGLAWAAWTLFVK